ncbi:hypothetical protein CDAR_183791 [Caerostris darwini]|uniref:Uncharacterized protein n=1 Tax=Caerostris darwini TaxID=1538125 RepID=A0AAV4TWT3_9ARAC|nr:hypothetical protein CDAR_183791 [Caerostris darwini]
MDGRETEFGSRSSPETFSCLVSLRKIPPKYCFSFGKTNALLSGHLDIFSGRISRIPRRGRVMGLPCPALIPQGRSACGQSALGLGCPGISPSLAEGNCEISKPSERQMACGYDGCFGIHLITDTSNPLPSFRTFPVGTPPAPPKTDIPPT